MKFSIVLLLLMALPAIVLSQDTNAKRNRSGEFYMEKSKNQKTAGWIMLGGGSGMFLIGLAIYTEYPKLELNQTEKLSPHAHVREALGLSK